MESIPDQLVVQPVILGYFFGAKKAIFVARETGIEVIHNSKHHLIAYQDLGLGLQHTNGFFFDRLHVQTSDGKLVVGWLTHASANQAMRLSVKAFYGYCSNPVLTLSKKIQTYVAKKYPRKAAWEAAQNLCDHWRSIYKDLPAKDMVSAEKLAAFNYIDQVSRKSIKLDQVQQNYTQQQLLNYKDYFDTVESNPLTDRQRLACIVDEKNNLVLAGAGSGKTSVMIGRAGFLLESQQASADQILMLAFANKAAGEMSERITEKLGIDSIKASTFHSLGQHIIATVENGKPSLTVMATDTAAYNQFINECSGLIKPDTNLGGKIHLQ